MKVVEKEGKTKEEAIKKACEELKVDPEELKIEVLSTGSKGLFGLGGKNVKIKATLKEKTMHQQDIVEKAKKVLEDILDRLNVERSITVEKKEEDILLKIKGDGSGFLIGRHGRTLDALEHLVNKIVSRADLNKHRILLDAEGYRARKDKSLVELALNLSKKVKKFNKPISINAMSPHDRRIIHMTLKNDEAVTTKSKGTGEYKKIIILPAKGNKEALTNKKINK